MEQFKEITETIRSMYEKFHKGEALWTQSAEPDSQNVVLPPWLCQPYVRDTPENHVKKVEDKRKEAEEKLVRKCVEMVLCFVYITV